MRSRLSDKAAKVLIVEALNSRRMMMTQSFRKAGWSSVLSAGTLKDAVAILESEPTPPDWIIAPLVDASSVNGLHLLSLTVLHEKLQGVRISLVIEPGSESILPSAYAMGLLSHHCKWAETDLQVNSLLEVPTIGQTMDWNETFMAATYLRRVLMDLGCPEDLVALESTLLATFPERNDQILKLAEAFLLAGKNQDALTVLSRAKGHSPALDATAADLLARAMNPAGKNTCQIATVAERLDLKTAVVIDPDESATKHTEDALKELGVVSIFKFHDGLAAWEWISANPEPDLIIQEWRLPKVSGDLFIQRLRQRGLKTCSVIVFSSLVKGSDRMLLREMGVTDVIEKPQFGKKLISMLTTQLQQDRKPDDEKALERKVRMELSVKNYTGARQYFAALCAKPNTTLGLKKSLEAEFLLHEGKLKKAHQLAIESVHMLGEDALVLNLLGKIYHKMGRPELAAKQFSRASELSPRNIERLCQLAQVQIEIGDQGAAVDAVKSARSLDAASDLVLETDARVSLVGGDTERVKLLMDQSGDNSRLVAFMNNRAVALVADKKISEASTLYKTALKSLPEKMKHLAPLIQYNLALSAVKSGNLDDAISHLLAAGRTKQGGANSKVKSLLDRASKAKRKGEPLKLKTSADSGPDAEVSEEIVEVVEGLPLRAGCRSGDFCCYLVYQPVRGIDSRFLQLLANGPRFRDRLASIGFEQVAG